jgi:hypothetical protein
MTKNDIDRIQEYWVNNQKSVQEIRISTYYFEYLLCSFKIKVEHPPLPLVKITNFVYKGQYGEITISTDPTFPKESQSYTVILE